MHTNSCFTGRAITVIHKQNYTRNKQYIAYLLNFWQHSGQFEGPWQGRRGQSGCQGVPSQDWWHGRERIGPSLGDWWHAGFLGVLGRERHSCEVLVCVWGRWLINDFTFFFFNFACLSPTWSVIHNFYSFIGSGRFDHRQTQCAHTHTHTCIYLVVNCVYLRLDKYTQPKEIIQWLFLKESQIYKFM